MVSVQPAFDVADRQLAERLFAKIRGISAAREGVTRAAYSEVESEVLEVIADTAAEYGLASHFDAAANLHVELPETREGPALWLGSHVDSVAEGGNYDGLAGVLAGLLCLIKAKKSGATLRQPLALVALRAEEAVWFGQMYVGSSALLGKLGENDLQRPHKASGRTLRESLAEAGADVERIASGTPVVDLAEIAGWLELHIEQGPRMVQEGVAVGVVSGIRGSTRHREVHCRGVAGHSGAVPRTMRHDAVLAAAHLMTRLDDAWKQWEDGGRDLVLTFGIVGTDPREHAETRIPGDVSFSIDIRSKDAETIDAFYQLFRDECSTIEAERGVRFEFDDRVVVEPAAVDSAWGARLHESAAALGYPCIDILSGAGHDAAVFSQSGIPAAMLFIRNENGSHNPLEHMEMNDFMNGVEVLYRAVVTELSA